MSEFPVSPNISVGGEGSSVGGGAENDWGDFHLIWGA